MTSDRTNWFSLFSQLRDRQQPIQVSNPTGTSENHIRCTDCGHLGHARIISNSIKYHPTGWRQFDIGFQIARIVTLVWCLIGLVGVTALNILDIEAAVWAPRVLLYCYAIALITSVSYATICMTPFDNCKFLVVMAAPASVSDRSADLPYVASADVACGQCGKQYPKVAVTEVVTKTADPFK